MSSIEWTNVTWNPVRGCSRVSSGCMNCYAERIAARFCHTGAPFDGFAERGGWTGKVELVRDKLLEPLTWRKPRLVFVNSMSDLFHEALSDSDIAAVFAVMAMSPRHTFQVLTKRAARMADWFERMRRKPGMVAHAEIRGGILALLKQWPRAEQPETLIEAVRTHEASEDAFPTWPLPNVWLGVSVENQETANNRIRQLLETPAVVRFISAEPLLGPIDLSSITRPQAFHQQPRGWNDWLSKKLHWVIPGFESGPGARPGNLHWIRGLVGYCAQTGIPCFVKQVGPHPYELASPPSVTEEERCRWLADGWCHVAFTDGRPDCFTKHPVIRDPKGGCPSEWPPELRVREFPKAWR